MWQAPWGYREGVAVVGSTVAIGFALQLTVGEFDFTLLRWPANLVIGVLLILLLAISAIRQGRIARWISSVRFAVPTIGALVAFGILMGLTPQVFLGAKQQGGVVSMLGLDNATSSYTFMLIYLLLLLSLGMVTAKRLLHFRWHDYGFYLNHAGLWLLLFAAGLGAADRGHFFMSVQEGATEWRAYDKHNELVELPIAVELNDFDMEVYPPKLAVIDRQTGEVFPKGRPEFFQIDEKIPKGTIGPWEVQLLEYIHDAVRNSDSTYHEVHMPGASPAARVRVADTRNNKTQEGWVCGGNMAQLYMLLNLDEQYALVSTRPEPKRFVSNINVYTQNGRTAHTLLEVNKPLKIGSWMLYQYDYDKEAGRMSSYSTFELVYDPWLGAVYAGLGLLFLGSVCMLWMGNRRKEVRNDVE